MEKEAVCTERRLGVAMMRVLFLLPSSLFNFLVSSRRLMLSSFEPFLFYIETAPYGELERIQRQTSTPVDTFASHPLQLREREGEYTVEELERTTERVQGRGEQRRRRWDYKRRKIYNPRMKFIRTSHLPLSTLRRLQRASLFALSFSLTTSPVLVLSIQPFLSFSYTLLVNSLTAGKDKGSDGANKRYPALS